jgi:hypothetical protein
MKQSSANVLRDGKREIRAIGDVCDASCFTWYACAHSKPNGVCEGFVLMNGETRKHLNRILNEDDAIYVQNCARMAQSECPEETREVMVQEVLRYIPPKEPEHQEGFANMVECAFGNQNGQPKNTESEPTLTRAIDESQFPALCNPMLCPPNYSRHCEANTPAHFGQPCIYRTPTNEELKHSETRAIDNDKLNNLLARLETLEKEVVNAENSAEITHVIPNRPNLCRPKNPNGLDEE